MKERPILFSAPMVRALLEGRKTQTRRLVQFNGAGRVQERGGSRRQWHRDDPNAVLACPYGQPDDRLWVRETFAIECNVEDNQPPHDGRPVRRYDYADGDLRWEQAHYRATDPDPDLCIHVGDEEVCGVRWKPSIHMPRWASRIDLRVTSVRVELVQAITEEDARAEGVTPFPHNPEGDCWTAAPRERAYRTAFEFLWGEINGFGATDARAPGSSWAENPWVWVVGFDRVDGARSEGLVPL